MSNNNPTESAAGIKEQTTISMTQEAASDPNVVTWKQPSDPENPREWPAKKKTLILINISLLAAVGEISSSIIAPSAPEIMAEFHSDNEELGILLVSIFLLGLAFGLLIVSGVSELHGRSPVFYTCSTLFVAFAVGSALARNIETLVIFRFFLGFVTAAAAGTGGGTIADMYVPQERGRATAVYALGNLVGPLLGPLVGGFLGQHAGWRWVCWLPAILGGAMMLCTFVVLRETYHPVLLNRRLKKLKKETGNDSLRLEPAMTLSVDKAVRNALGRPLKLLIFSPVVSLPCLGVAVMTGFLYLLISSLATEFQRVYGLSVGASGLAYLGLNLGLIISLFLFAATSDRAYKKVVARGEVAPEIRLTPVIFAAPLACAGLVMYGWTLEKRVHWMAPIVGTAIFGFAWMLFQMPVTTYLIDVYKLQAASAIGANAFLRSILGGVLPLCAGRLYASLGYGWGNSLLAIIALGFSPLPFLFLRKGEKLREKSVV